MTGAASRWLAIVNPASGAGRAGRAWPRLQSELHAVRLACEVVQTTAAGDGEAIARRAVLEGRRRLIIVGGDGSANDVVNGIMSARLPGDDPVTVAIVPSGTGDDWARGLGVPRRPQELARVIARGHSIPHDLGLLEWAARGAVPAGRRWFANVAGAGFDAWVLERGSPAVRSRFAYLAGALRGLLSYHPPEFTVQADNARISARLLAVFVAIGPYCGAGMHVAPGARSDDGLFDVVAIRHPGLAGTLRRLPSLYSGAILRNPIVRHLRVDRLSVRCTPPATVQADGQVHGGTPAEFTCRRAAIRVVRPVERGTG
jgi:diacylglycerol kinase (ATP)